LQFKWVKFDSRALFKYSYTSEFFGYLCFGVKIMRSLVTYLLLCSFSFLSLTPSGLTLAQLRADDDFELDELDLGLEDEEDVKEPEEEVEKPGKDSKKSDYSFDDAEDSAESDMEDSEGSFSEDSGKQKIAAFYLFPDSFSQKSSGNIVAETASYLAGSEYDYLKTEAALFVPSMSVAKRDLEEGLKTFEEAKALYNDLSIEEAITKFQSARKTIEKHLDKIPDMKVLGDILLYLGASYKMLDEDDEATPLFSSYLSIYPDAELDDIVFSPEIISFFDRIKEDFLMLPNGSVRVESFPEGALVSINGKIVGITPTKVHGITEGRHYYRIHKNGYRDRAGTFTVRERKESKIAEDLSKYDNAGFLHEAESFMVKEYGRLAMLRKCVEIAEKMKVDSVLVTSLTVDGETVKYSGHIVNREKRNFKKVETSFLLPDRKDLTEVDELQKFNKDLINDTYGFKPISDVALDEAELLGLDTKKDKKDKGPKTPIHKQWWLWTLLGVVVLGGAGVGTYFAVTASQGKESGASLEINFK